MRLRYLSKSQPAVRGLAMVLICALLLPGITAWGAVVIPPATLMPLNQIPVPQPPNLFQFVKDKAAAVRLGKALYWDMQAGSDGLTACGTCHFRAGADSRLKNTLHPGHDGIFQAPAAAPGPNQTLQTTDFPFHQRFDPADQFAAVTRDIDDVAGSQGVRKADFAGITPGRALDNVTDVSDAVFTAGGQNVRQVTDRNTPTVINAVFNFANFWDGRAHFIFNGSSPFGPADANAGVWFHNGAGATLVKKPVSIEFASLASQAVGPPLNNVEMSANGRTFPEVGRKLLSLTPLGKQQVHPGDSVLGSLTRAIKQADGTMSGANGLNVTYSQMIEAAFQNNLWNSPQTVTLNTAGGAMAFSQMEANFALFWGLAIQQYEATLIADQTPFDRWLGGDSLALSDEQKQGFAIFQGIGNCIGCHGTSELTNVSGTSVAFVNNNDNGTIDLMFVADGTQVIYDNGFNNTGVTRTTDDIGRGGDAPFLNPLDVDLNGVPRSIPLSFSHLAELQALGKLPFATPILPFTGPNAITPDFPLNEKGLFKVPGLRNVELTPPYFHNGGARTLEEVVEFYARGGNFPYANINDLDPVILGGIPLLQNQQNDTPVQTAEKAARRAALVAFLKSLTDQRVVTESAPFDHPEIFVPEGDPEVLTRMPAHDAAGNAAPQTNLTLNAVISPTNVDTQLIFGTVQAGMTAPQVTVNGGPPIIANVTGSNWNATIAGLQEGANSIGISATETAASLQTTITTTITLHSAAPPLTMDPVTTPTGLATQTLTGTVEVGATVKVAVNGGAAELATVTGSFWSYAVTLPVVGENSIVVSVRDPVGNTSSLAAVSIIRNPSTQPVAVNDAAMTTTGVAKSINVLANDLGVSSPLAPGTVAFTTTPIGSAVINPDGTVTYTSSPGYAGADSFAYTVRDTLGTLSTPAIVTIGVEPAPPAVGEIITPLRAQFRADIGGSGDWVIEGTTTDLLATLITVYAGNSLEGVQIGNAIPVGGKWLLHQAGSPVLPDATSTISVQSPSGATRLAFPVAVR
jgi:cytochrome c peroxidase